MFKHKPGGSGDEYATPKWVWEPWHNALDFKIDAAASSRNRLPVVRAYYSKAYTDAFEQPWAKDLEALGGGAIWCNPPYSRHGGTLKRWVQKALDEANNGAVVCMLLPSDTSTDWFTLLWNRAQGCWRDGVQGYFTDTRIRFIDVTGKPTKGSPTFGSLVVVLRRKCAVARNPAIVRWAE